jgi:3-hydroxybutyryl-CoA dehydrogenase
MEIRSVVIIGAGTMGRGIVASFRRGGHDVTLVSRDPAKAGGHVATDVRIVAQLPDDTPDFIIEAVPEDIDLKHALFAGIEARYGAHPIIATNTSGLSMDAMAARLKHPERFIGVHYMQPADALPMVEVIRVAATSDGVLAATTAALARNGQDALVLNRPVPGFLVNRLQHAMMHEALAMIEQGLCTVEDVDNFARRMLGPRMCVTGLIEQKDISGLHITAATHRNLIPDLNHTNTPVALLQDMVAAGNHGMATGQGFYDWRDRDTDAYKRRVADKLARILKFLAEDGD